MTTGATEGMVLYRIREHVYKNGKESLLDIENLVGVIAIAMNELLDLDKESHSDRQTSLFQESIAPIKNRFRLSLKENAPELYTDSLADNLSFIRAYLPSILKEVQPSIDYLYESFGVKNYDCSLNPREQREILQNTIEVFKTKFKILKNFEEYDEYEKYLQESIEKHLNKKSTTGKSKYESLSIDFIIGTLERKINNEDELGFILNSMQNLNTNFYTVLDNKNIYPIILDLLIDTTVIDFQFFLDKSIIQKNIEVWDEAKKSHLKRGFYTQNTFYKIDFIEQVTYRRSRSYLLHEYSKELQKEDIVVRNLFQSVLYNTIENSKGSPKLPDDNFIDIKPRRFLLENTKIVLGKI